MNIYLIEQDENTSYDTFDSAVVVAESEEQAKQIKPQFTYEAPEGVFMSKKKTG